MNCDELVSWTDCKTDSRLGADSLYLITTSYRPLNQLSFQPILSNIHFELLEQGLIITYRKNSLPYVSTLLDSNQPEVDGVVCFEGTRESVP